jgi:hypothetical protein
MFLVLWKYAHQNTFLTTLKGTSFSFGKISGGKEVCANASKEILEVCENASKHVFNHSRR